MTSILVDAHCFDGNGQGMVSYLQGLYKQLLKNKEYDITFACHNIEKLRNFFDVNVKIIRIPKKNAWYRLLIFFPKILRKYRFDFVHFQYMIPFFLNKNVKYVTTIHDIIPIDFPAYYSFFYRLKVNCFFRKTAKKSDILLTVSEYSKKRISKKFHVDENNIFITPNAVKDVFESELNEILENKINGRYILFVSRIEKRKNHITLLKAFVEGDFYQNYFLVFVGTYNEEINLLDQYLISLDSNIRSKVIFLSGLSDKELACVYSKASLFVYPSIAEGFGIPPLEAAMYSVKVVCSNSTAMSDFIFFKKYAFNPLDTQELVQKMKNALVDSNYPHKEIKKQIREKYSWEESAAVFDATLRMLGARK